MKSVSRKYELIYWILQSVHIERLKSNWLFREQLKSAVRTNFSWFWKAHYCVRWKYTFALKHSFSYPSLLTKETRSSFSDRKVRILLNVTINFTWLKNFSLKAANNNLKILLEFRIDYNNSNRPFANQGNSSELIWSHRAQGNSSELIWTYRIHKNLPELIWTYRTQGNSRELKGTQGNSRELKGTQGN